MSGIWESEFYIDQLQRGWKRERKDIKETIGGLVKQGNVVDVGCGVGRMADLFSRSSYLGIDSSKAMLEKCKGKGITVRQGSVYNTQCATGSMDCVLSHAVLFHIKNIPAAIDELWRITKHGGRLVFSVYCDHRIKHLGCEVIVNENPVKGVMFASFRNVLPYWMLCRTIGEKMWGVLPIGQKLRHVRRSAIHWVSIPKQVSYAIAVVDKTG